MLVLLWMMRVSQLVLLGGLWREGRREVKKGEVGDGEGEGEGGIRRHLSCASC